MRRLLGSGSHLAVQRRLLPNPLGANLRSAPSRDLEPIYSAASGESFAVDRPQRRRRLGAGCAAGRLGGLGLGDLVEVSVAVDTLPVRSLSTMADSHGPSLGLVGQPGGRRIVLLLFNFGWLDAYAPGRRPAGCGCAVAAAVFFAGFARNRQEWWRLLPAWTLTSLATMVVTEYACQSGPSLDRSAVFAGLALAFGTSTSLAHRALVGDSAGWIHASVGSSCRRKQLDSTTEVLAALLFIGLGLVFFFLYFWTRSVAIGGR